MAIAVVAVLAAGAYGVWRGMAPATPATEAPVTTLSDAAIDSRLSLARSSLNGRNYRAAMSYATSVLAVDAGHAEATRIRDEAREQLARFDEAVGRAREELAAGDVQGAARSLEAARAIDPASPAVVELSSRLSEVARERDAARARHLGAPAPGTAARADGFATAAATGPRAGPGTTAAAPAPPQVDAPFPATALPPPPAPAPAPPPAPPLPVPEPTVTTPPAEPLPNAPSPPAATRPPEPAAATPSRDEADETAIRRVVATYGRAIETKDLALFRSVKPNMSANEERRLQQGFRAVSSQRVNLTIASIDRRGETASVVVQRRDVLEVSGRTQTAETRQVLSLARAGDGWVIVEIR